MTERHEDTRGRRGASAAMATSDAYQVDVMLAFFAVLLILLLTSVVQIAQQPEQPSRLQYRPEDATTVPFQLRSMATAYPYRGVWIARDGELTELDMTALAQLYGTGTGSRLEQRIGSAQVRIQPDDPGAIDSYQLRIDLGDAGLPEPLSRRRVALADTEQLFDALAGDGRGALIYAWSETLPAMAPALNRLRAEGICHKLVIDPREDRIKLRRSYPLFAGEVVLRCF